MRLEEIRDRLKDRRLYVVAKKTGLSYQTLYTIVKGENQNPSIKTVEALEAYLNGQHLTPNR